MNRVGAAKRVTRSEKTAIVQLEPLEGRTLFSTVITPLAALPAITATDPTYSAHPYTGALVRDSAGNLYGVQPSGGAGGFGLIFKVDATTHALSTVYTFDGTAGVTPTQIAIDSADNLFGITENVYGGPNSPPVNKGTLFEIPLATTGALATLCTFSASTGGTSPAAFVLDDADNSFVLMNSYQYGLDSVVEVTPAGAADFVALVPAYDTATSGTAIGQSLTYSNGNFYGTTSDGGAAGAGTLFKLAGGTTAAITLAEFDDTTTGRAPDGGPYIDADGNVFGTAQFGGAGGYGTVYEYSASGQSLTALTSFDGNAVAHPLGNLVSDGNGNQLGTYSEGGVAAGGVFSVNTSTHAVTNTDFDDAEGGTPITGLVAGAAGTFYGYTSTGAANSAGEVFAVTTSGGGATSGGSDLSATIAKSTLPASVVSASPVKGGLSLTVTNTSGAAIKSADTISVYASTTGTNQTGDTPIATITKTLPLKAGASKPINFKIKTLTLPAGTYTLLAQASDATGTFTATTGPTLQVAAPFVSLAATVSPVTPAAVKLGKPFTFTVTITNSGNIDSVGVATFAIGLSTDGSTVALPLKPVTKSLKIKAGGKPTIVKLHAVLPSDALVTTYYPLVSFTQGTSTFTAVGSSPLSIA